MQKAAKSPFGGQTKLGVIFLFPYYWGGLPIGTPNSMPMGMLPFLDWNADKDFRELPEEVREALEYHQDEIHSASDLHHLVDELKLRK